MAILRFVQFTATEGRTEELKTLVAGSVVSINERYGCKSCQVMQSANNPASFAIVSVWNAAADLQAMRAQPDYQELLAGIKNLSAPDLKDTIYEVLA